MLATKDKILREGLDLSVAVVSGHCLYDINMCRL